MNPLDQTQPVSPGKLKLVLPKPISIKDHPMLTERWIEEQLILNPVLLGLGELPRAGSE